MAPLLPRHAAFDGWSPQALAMAAQELGVPADRAALCFPGGQADMIDAWFDSIDRAMLEAFPPDRIAAMAFRTRRSGHVCPLVGHECCGSREGIVEVTMGAQRRSDGRAAQRSRRRGSGVRRQRTHPRELAADTAARV